MYNDMNDSYVLAEYIVTDEETKRPVHRRVNLQYKRNPFNGAILSARIYGTWRRSGFWTEKDYKPEKGFEEIFTRAQAMFMNPEVIRRDEEFAKAKAELDKEISNALNNVDGAEHVTLGVYGADHSHMSLGSTPVPTDTTAGAPIDVRTMI